MEKLIAISYGYALILGITSYRLVNGRFRKCRITQAYTIICNVVVIVALPRVLLKVAKVSQVAHCFRKTLYIVPYVLYSVNYAVVVYILISRWYRDSVMVELQDLANRISQKIERKNMTTSPVLGRLLLTKSFTLLFLSLSSLLWMPFAFDIWELLSQWVTIIAYCILNTTTYLYFLSFWQVARGFDFINRQQERCDSEELRDLWVLHSTLRRVANKINKIYGLQMVVSRIDYIVFTIVFGYTGIIYSQGDFSLFKVYSAITYWIRSLDFFLNDYISDLENLYECQSNPSLIEGPTYKEISAFLLYKTNSRSQLKVLGLYPANRNIWLRMMGFIICQSTLLVQFYMVL